MTTRAATSSVTVRVPAKVNLALRVGPTDGDGYHALATVFHAIGLYDEVTVRPADRLSLTVSGPQAELVPTDRSNLAWRAAERMMHTYDQLCGVMPRGPVAVHIDKAIPVAGGMAGGSADAAATLLAVNHLWGDELMPGDLRTFAAELGSDVPFALEGGTALGTGRGDEVSPALSRGELHWVVAHGFEGLSTPAVYREFDRLNAPDHRTDLLPEAEPPTELLQALAAGDPAVVARHLENDLQEATLSLRPDLRAVLDAGRELGALSGIVSGSGPSIAFLTADHESAIDLSIGLAALREAPEVAVASGPVPGARVVSG
ncbi:4-(cytidine 5'-diphospho)-2-C-methyl-D-erythritol kinase [Kytococcus sp. Marseille-QA3725]